MAKNRFYGTYASYRTHFAADGLSFTLATRGTLRSAITEDAQGVRFQDAAGATVLNYSGLKVWDADGKVLPSHFEAAGENSIRLLVDERGARYPITIDPIAQQAYLKASNTGAGDLFGWSVAVSGDTVIVGAPNQGANVSEVGGGPPKHAPLSGAGLRVHPQRDHVDAAGLSESQLLWGI